MFDKILIANRGEIALRVIRTCRDMGIRTVAVYTPEDGSAMHVRLADECLPLNSPLGYRDGPRLLEAAKQTQSQAIHPGYGFLAEDPVFAAACAEAGVTFIGPPPALLSLFQDKIGTLHTAAAAGYATPPVSDKAAGPDEDTRLERQAAALGCGAAELIEARNGAHAPVAEGESYLLIARYDPEQHGSRETLSHDKGAAEVAFRAEWLGELTRTPANQLAAITMDGDSMAPTIGPDDSLVVDLTQWSPGGDGIYVLRHGGRLLVKRLAVDPLRQLVTLSSDNPNYAALAPVTMAELDLVGRVIWIGKRV